MMDVGEVPLGNNLAQEAEARRRAQRTWPAIVGFTAGASLGAACFAAVGLWSLALLALAMGVAPTIDGGRPRLAELAGQFPL